MNSNSKFIKKLYFSSLFPNIIAVLGGTVNVFFDGILVGQKLGDTGLAAVNQSLPIYLILCTIGSLFSSGASFLSSIAIGENKKEKSVHIFRASMTVSFLAGIFFMLLGLGFLKPITAVLSTPDTFTFVSKYVKITLICGVFKVLLYVPFFYLRLEGKHKRSASAMIVMTLLNIVLDYLFLFVFNMGIEGAAWASGIATIVACIMCFVFLFTDRPNFSFGLAFFGKKDLADTLKFGLPMAFNNVTSSVRILLLNLIIKSVGGSAYIAVFAVVNNLNEFSICIQNGVPQTASAMTGIFFGEKDSPSIKKLLKIQLATGLILSSAFAFVASVFSGYIGKLFGSEYDCRVAVICLSVSLIFATLNHVLMNYYTAVDKVGVANLVTIFGGFVFMVLFCYLFRGFGEFIWLFLPVTEILTLAVVLFGGFLVSRKKKLTPFYLIDETFEKSGVATSFSVDCDNEKICEASERIKDFCEQNDFDTKKTMAISLAIEEILTIISQKSLFGSGSMDVRVLKSGQEAILRVRSGGIRYDPIAEQNDDLDYMGVKMITKMANRTEYLSSLGVNTLIIHL